MTVNKYIDWWGLYRDLVSKQLEEMPTIEIYKQELEGCLIDFSFADRLYDWLLDTRDLSSEFELNSNEDNQYFRYRQNTGLGYIFFSFDDGDECSYTIKYSSEFECFISRSVKPTDADRLGGM